jgi:hypothetical protein
VILSIHEELVDFASLPVTKQNWSVPRVWIISRFHIRQLTSPHNELYLVKSGR